MYVCVCVLLLVDLQYYYFVFLFVTNQFNLHVLDHCIDYSAHDGSLLGDVLVANLAIILPRKRESWFLYVNRNVADSVLCFFLMVPCLGLQSVIVAYPGHTHFCKKQLR